MPYSEKLDVRVTDTSLRDGSHAKQHKFTTDEVVKIASALDEAGVPVIEVAHGDGLGGSSFNYGFSSTDERELIKAAVDNVKQAKIACLMLPGVGIMHDIHAIKDIGASIVRIATHCTEADIAIQHFGMAREIGLETVGFLMMGHKVDAKTLAEQAKIQAGAGCQCVYVVDSAGAMLPDDVAVRVDAVREAVGPMGATVGFHGHENLSLSMGNTLVAVRHGAVQVDGSTRRFGAGAGNTATEAIAAVFDKAGITTGIDPIKIMDVAEDVVLPIMDYEPNLSRLAMVMGYAGVYSSFLRHAYRAAEQYGVSGADILLECGERNLIGGQEDQIIRIASELANRR